MTAASLAHVYGRLGVVEQRIRELVAVRRAADPAPDDPFRGLYLSDDVVDRLLEGPREQVEWPASTAQRESCETAADLASEAGVRLRLRDLAAAFDLSSTDLDLLLVAAVADVEPRFESFFGYLNDDVSRRRPSVAVALELAGVPLSSPGGYAHLVHGPLARHGLVELEDPERPFPGRALRVPDRVTAHLLGDDSPDAALAPVLGSIPDLPWGDPGPLAHALAADATLVYLREPATGSGRLLAAAALRRTGHGVLVLDLERVARQPDPVGLARRAAREARLSGAGIVAGPVAALRDRVDVLEALDADPRPLLLVGDISWDPAWLARPPLQIDVPSSTAEERMAVWRFAMAGALTEDDAMAATTQFRMRPDEVARAAESARVQALVEPDGRIGARHVRSGARSGNGSALERLARRIDPAVSWADLVLPPQVLTALEEVALRARHREQVLGDWRMRPGGGRGVGVAALFAGDSGTGKTMSAEVIAQDLGLELYVVDLATVVDKYVGETEKNLERIFSAAAGVNAVLLFDEADAVFGKRSEVRDAHDRYANVESAYLLQRMESFDGLAILATNLRANIDDAFTRRLDVLVDFPVPDAHHRRSLWDACLGRTIRRSPDVDLPFLADSFELAGGSIRSAAVTAAYLAAADSGVIGMRHLVAAVHREYRKLGRLTRQAEFGPYWALVRETA
ncbi:ATP-binding protein [Nocardioides albidus]|uniref:ATP-binding protein n=1 Tax=Nocardioides albidus TaxID=1517589 RepID=A0A5C4VWK8_9ACTN|nr:ATP-binding protein [Nocardioides albidus]TNM39695.1 ATP-binding protein [Nocardioides albidus]